MIDFILGFAIAISGALALGAIRGYRRDLKQLGDATSMKRVRDMSDLEVAREFGQVFGHSDDPRLIALIKRLEVEKAEEDADREWAQLNEPWINDAIRDAFAGVGGQRKC